MGGAKAAFSVFEAEAKGPNISAEVSLSPMKFEVMVSAKTGSASESAGLIKRKMVEPKASAEISVSSKRVKAMASAEIARASVSAGPIKAKIRLAVNTGVKIDKNKMNLQVLGTGFKSGPHTSDSVK